MMNPEDTWRNDAGLIGTPVYKRKFALVKRICSDGSTVWMKPYYKKFITWSHGDSPVYYDQEYGHTDFIENVTEAEYLVRKLSDNL